MSNRLIVETIWSKRTKGQRRKYGSKWCKPVGVHSFWHPRAKPGEVWHSDSMRAITRIWHKIHAEVEYSPTEDKSKAGRGIEHI